MHGKKEKKQPTCKSITVSYSVHVDEHHEGIPLTRGVLLPLEVGVDQLRSIRDQLVKVSVKVSEEIMCTCRKSDAQNTHRNTVQYVKYVQTHPHPHPHTHT